MSRVGGGGDDAHCLLSLLVSLLYVGLNYSQLSPASF